MTTEFVVDGAQNIIAIILWREGDDTRGIRFVTPKHFPLQLGYMVRERDYEIKRHRHKPWKREVHTTQEVLIVREGIVEVDLYGMNRELVCSKVLAQDDIIMLAAGSHAIRFRDNATLIEVKQGPYVDAEVDKEWL